MTTGDRERMPETIDLYTDAFAKDPLVNYFMNSVNDKKREQLRPHVFKVFLECGALNDGIFYHATADGVNTGRGCRAMIMKPGKSIDGVVTALRAFHRSSFMSLYGLGPGTLYVSSTFRCWSLMPICLGSTTPISSTFRRSAIARTLS